MNCLLVNFVIVDFFVGLFFFLRIFYVGFYIYFSGLVGDILCKILINGNFIYLVVVVLILILVFIVWERYFVVIYLFSFCG